MKKKISAALLAFMLVFQVMSSSYMMPFTALATESNATNQTNSTGGSAVTKPSEEEQKEAKVVLDNATKLVNELFTDETNKQIKDSTVDAIVNTAEVQVNLVAEGEEKTNLQKLITEARMQIAAKVTEEPKEEVTTTEATEEKAEVVKEETKATEETKEVVKATPKKKALKTSATTDLTDFITSISLTKGYQSLDILDPSQGMTLDQEFGVKVEFKLVAAATKGDTFTYTLPAGTYIKEAGSVALAGDIIGTLDWATGGMLTLTLAEDIPAGSEGGFVFRSWLASTISETPFTIEYTNDVTKNIVVKINEKNVPSPQMKKTVSNNGVSFNTKELLYTVEFSAVKDAAEFFDELPAHIKYKSDLKIERGVYNKFTGEFSALTDDTSKWSTLPTTGADKIKLTRTDGIGLDKYKITFNASVEDTILATADETTNSALVAANKAELLKTDASVVIDASSATMKINYATPYVKKVTGYDNKTQTVTWRIIYNQRQANLPEQKITDTLSGVSTTGIKDFKVYKAKLTETNSGIIAETNGEDATKASYSAGVITVPTTSEALIFEYKTQASGLVTGGSITNTADIKDVWNSGPISRSLDNTVGTKYAKGIDYSTKTASWELNLNSASEGVINAGAIITDTFETNSGLKLLPDTVEVKVAGTATTLAAIGATLDSTKAADGTETGFTINFGSVIPKNTVITYDTSYNIIGSNHNYVKNTATMNYNGGLSYTLGAPAPGLNAEAQNDGNKSGKYDPITKTITWTLNVNYYGATMSNPKIKDTLSGEQSFVENSMIVKKATVAKDGKITAGAAVTDWIGTIDTTNSKILNITGPATITEPYQITYQTKLDTKEIKDGSVYVNNAILTSTGRKDLTFTATPDIPNGGHVISKSYKKSGTKKFNWTVDINKAQSHLLNTVITDTATGTVSLDPNSFKLTKRTYNTVSAKWETVDVSVSDKLTIDGINFTVKLGDITEAYTLTYTSFYEGSPDGEDLSNSVELKSTNVGKTNGVSATKAEVGYTTGLAWINTKPTLSIQKIKAQSDNDTDVKIGNMENILFSIYDETKENKLTSGTTNAEGKLTFSKALAAGYYYLVEETALTGFQTFGYKNAASYLNGATSTKDNQTIDGHKAIRVEISGKTLDSATAKTVTMTIRNYVTTPEGCSVTFINQDGQTATALPSAEFKITNKAGDIVVANVTAGTDGRIVTPKIPTGDYVLVQTKAPGDYPLAKNIEFTVDKDTCSTTSIPVENSKVCDDFTVVVRGINDNYNNHATFNVVDKTNKVAKNTDGTILENLKLKKNTAGEYELNLKNMPIGEYKLVQIEVPVGQKMIPTTDIKLAGGKECSTPVVIVVDSTTIACSSYAIVAVDGAGKEMTTATAGYTKFVNEAKFTLKDSTGVVLENITIDSSTGKLLKSDTTEIALADLKENEKYTLEQSNTVIGYTKLAATDVTPSLTDCLAKVNVTIKDITVAGCTTFEITIKDETGAILNSTSKYFDSFAKNSEFTLVSSDKSITPITGVKINTTGKLVKSNGDLVGPKDLTSGEYTLVQTKTPPGFTPAETAIIPNGTDCSAYAVINFELTTNPTTPGISCPDFTINYNGPAASQAEFKLVKVDTDAITGAKKETVVTTDVKVVTDATTKKQTLEITNITGKVITALEAGDYKLEQTKAHPGYQTTSATFTVVEGVCSAELTVTNSPTPPPVCERDTVISITDKEGKKVVPNDKAVVTVDGEIVDFTIDDDKIEIRKYEISKTKDTVVTITLEDGRTTTTTLLKNRVECTVDVEVSVLNLCSKNPTISVTTKEGKEVPTDLVEKVTVNGKETPVVTENGKVVIPKDSVNPKEDTTVIVILKDGTEGTVKIPNFTEECTFTIVVDQACDKLTVNVTNNDKAVKSGTVEILDADGKVVATAKIDTKGQATFEAKYANSKYDAKVTVGNKAQTAKITIDEKCAITVELVNACETLTVNVTKNGQAVKSGTVDILDATSKVVATMKVNENSQAIFEGKYATSEYSAKVTIDGKVSTVVIKVNTKCAITVDVVIYACEKPTVSVKVDGVPEENLTVKVVDNSGKTVQTVITDENGFAKINPKYADDNHKVVVTIFNEKKSYAFHECAVEINVKPKVDVKDEIDKTPTAVSGETEKSKLTPKVDGKVHDVSVPAASPGQKYNVYDEQGNLISKNVIVGKDGKIDIKNLSAGNYKLVSTDGQKTIKFTVGKDGKLPQTGSSNTEMYTIFGVVILAVAIWLFTRNRRKSV